METIIAFNQQKQILSPNVAPVFNFKQMRRTQKSSDPGLSILPVRARHSAVRTAKGGGQITSVGFMQAGEGGGVFDWA